ncbi:hypothetical protein BT69DRAFT_1155713 [Atractiella rhizophila]|nr:hypothetical protein BT69DRAFT_1155713 [Atractiella rhizophila]
MSPPTVLQTTEHNETGVPVTISNPAQPLGSGNGFYVQDPPRSSDGTPFIRAQPVFFHPDYSCPAQHGAVPGYNPMGMTPIVSPNSFNGGAFAPFPQHYFAASPQQPISSNFAPMMNPVNQNYYPQVHPSMGMGSGHFWQSVSQVVQPPADDKSFISTSNPIVLYNFSPQMGSEGCPLFVDMSKNAVTEDFIANGFVFEFLFGRAIVKADSVKDMRGAFRIVGRVPRKEEAQFRFNGMDIMLRIRDGDETVDTRVVGKFVYEVMQGELSLPAASFDKITHEGKMGKRRGDRWSRRG